MFTHCPAEAKKEKEAGADMRVIHTMIHRVRALIWCLAQLRICIHFQTRQSVPSPVRRRQEEGGRG